MNEVLDDILMHYGMPRRSGRYPWGSGKDPYQHSGDFISRVEELRKQNFTFTDPETGELYSGDLAIAKSMGLTSTQFRTQYSLAKDERRSYDVARAKSLREDGLSLREIGKEMGINESTVRSYLNPESEQRMNRAKETAEVLKKFVDENGMVDVGAGTEHNETLGGISREKLKEALYILEMEGYPTYVGSIPQATNPGQKTNIKVLCPPGTAHKEIYNYENVNQLDDYILDPEKKSIRPTFIYPESMDSNRLQIRYAEEGGLERDGLVEIRRGVKDLDLGEGTHYAQVRILVDGTHYIKGMAVYSDDLPEGKDIIFNTNKPIGTDTKDVLKKIKDDPDNPFGSLIKEKGGQSFYDDPNGKYEWEEGKKQSLSLINKRAEESDWDEWSKSLSSQFLSKQNLDLAKKQLYLAESEKQLEYETICNLTNQTIKRNLLQSFADDCDASAVHLKAAALPRQRYQVILPLVDIKDDEVYAPNFNNGEKVALVRFPHGSTSEIPILKVNNHNEEGIKYLGSSPKDAIGINKKNADRLSGADFDGDTVLVIPVNSKVNISNKDQLRGLKDFDPKEAYKGEIIFDKDGKEHYYRNGKEFKPLKKSRVQNEMGAVSNLITDMTLKGANDDEIAAAIRHSMVIIDAEKHKLDYKQSYIDNNIGALKRKYQLSIDDEGNEHTGASTIISRSKSPVAVPKRVGSPKIDPNTGEKIYKEVEEYYIDKKGKTQLRTTNSTKMAETKDARTLISDANTDMERVYADYANKMKSLGNQARKEYLSTPRQLYSPQANKAYAKEVESLNRKLQEAEKNAPRERKAQALTAVEIRAKKQLYPDMTKKEEKKLKQQALTKNREKVGAHREKIEITDKEWDAIQAGAITDSKLERMLKYTDTDKLKERAMPRQTKNSMTPAKLSRMANMKNSGFTNAEIAEALGVSVSTVIKYS